MPRGCITCARPDRSAVDTALRSGETLRALAQRFGTSAAALFRHRASHLSPQEPPAATEPAQEQNRQSHHSDSPAVTAHHVAPPVTEADLPPASTDQQANTPPETIIPGGCPICVRADRSAIDLALRSPESLRALAQRFGTNPVALFRHRTRHLNRQTPAASEPAQEQCGQVPHPDPPTVAEVHLPPPATKADMVPASTDEQANTSPRTPCPKCGEKSWRQMPDGRVLCAYCHKLPTY
jgi:transposase-like protein